MAAAKNKVTECLLQVNAMRIANSKLACILIVALVCCSKIDKMGESGDSLTTDSSKKHSVELEYNYTHDNYVRDVLKPYIDSLDHYKQKHRMPSFLYDDDFEHKLKEKQWSLNNCVSVREKINIQLCGKHGINGYYFVRSFFHEKK